MGKVYAYGVAVSAGGVCYGVGSYAAGGNNYGYVGDNVYEGDTSVVSACGVTSVY